MDKCAIKSCADNFLQSLGVAYNELGTFSYGERFQDIFALVVGLATRECYFVDFGGMHPYNRNNTYLLERVGWRGILAEPNPAFSQDLLSHRNCQIEMVAVDVTPRLSTLHIPMGKRARATLDVIEDIPVSKVQVQVISLDELMLRAGDPPVIGFFSIDVEGGEWDIIRNFPNVFNKALSICVEWGEKREEIYEFLTALGFERVLSELSGVDDWYVKGCILEKFSTRGDLYEKEIKKLAEILSSEALPDPGFSKESRNEQISVFSSIALSQAVLD
ncbi:FkbM family methyltransferase [Microbulbifer hydrolyticus]|uniref:FkbM family methyltransferase n=1 Tax=Microbulbifer hydrolyticus TaxID=48074 RepID=A0A6P1TBA9_9GAMM|nr:FkbM family methyltransferase [Microbulbifer hydrolyticus]MBB5210601.1 FkbM family methyltransferase [Microbulbifer hydrolyticus]QHQ38933.1 hypothetical protein GTQ55_08025 [Microbulbifer hydrolyticus]